MLRYIDVALQAFIRSFNESNKSGPTTPHISQSFIAEGDKTKSKAPNHRRSFLSGANDWQMLVDYKDCKITFPPSIYSTPERPDIIIWSVLTKRVLLIELTCPAEEGISGAASRKIERYENLVDAINSKASKYTCTLWTIEVGARGFPGRSIHRCLKKLGFDTRSRQRLCAKLALVAATCSHHIYLCSDTRKWKSPPLLVLPMDENQTLEKQDVVPASTFVDVDKRPTTQVPLGNTTQRPESSERDVVTLSDAFNVALEMIHTPSDGSSSGKGEVLSPEYWLNTHDIVFIISSLTGRSDFFQPVPYSQAVLDILTLYSDGERKAMEKKDLWRLQILNTDGSGPGIHWILGIFFFAKKRPLVKLIDPKGSSVYSKPVAEAFSRIPNCDVTLRTSGVQSGRDNFSCGYICCHWLAKLLCLKSYCLTDRKVPSTWNELIRVLLNIKHLQTCSNNAFNIDVSILFTALVHRVPSVTMNSVLQHCKGYLQKLRGI